MARKAAKKPDLDDDVLTTLGQYETYWGTLHAEMDIDYAIVNNLQAISVPQGYNATYLGTASALIGSAADHIAGDHPTIEVPEANNSEKARERSERLEKGFQAAQYKIDTEQTDNIRRTIVVNGLWSGMFVSKGPIFIADAWGLIPTQDGYEDQQSYQTDLDEYEASKKLNWPILRKAVDPRTVFPDPGTIGRRCVIIKEKRTAGSVQAQWPSWDRKTRSMVRGDKPLPETYLGDWVEYWDEHYRVYSFDGTLIDKVREHAYRKPPLNIRSAGYGIDTGKPEERFRSIIYPARGLLNQQIAAFNQLDALMRRTAWPVILQPTGAGMEAIVPGTVQDIPQEYIAAIRAFSEFQPAVIQGLIEELNYLEAQIEQATFPNVVKGIRAKGIASGYGQNSLVAEAKVKFGPAVVNLESLEAEFYVDLGHCVQHVIEEPLPVWGKTKWGMLDAVLDPKDLQDLRNVVVTVNPKLPTDRANEIAIMQVLLSLGLIDKATAISDYAGYPQPGQMLERIYAERAMDSPEIQRVINLAAALENGYIDYVLEAAGELAKKTGADPNQVVQMLLNTMGFGQQPPPGGPPTGPVPGGQPNNIAAQIGVRPAVPAQSLLGQQNKAQPNGPLTGSLTQAVQKAQTPGTPSNVRNQVVPGVPIG